MTREEVRIAQEAMRELAASGQFVFNPKLVQWAEHYRQQDLKENERAQAEARKKKLAPVVSLGRFVGKFSLGLLKWTFYVALTVWATYSYGWQGLFTVPLIFALLKLGVALSNWADHWSKPPVSKSH
jgi:hypothetical protein